MGLGGELVRRWDCEVTGRRGDSAMGQWGDGKADGGREDARTGRRNMRRQVIQDDKVTEDTARYGMERAPVDRTACRRRDRLGRRQGGNG